MAKFIELTSGKSDRPVLVNVDAIAWVGTREATGEPLVTVIRFTAAHAADALSITVKEGYEVVTKKITAG